MIHRNYWLVVGRVIGDHEDHARHYQHCTREDAIAFFKEDAYRDEGVYGETREMLEANGEGAVVNLIVASDSPIEEM